MNDITSLTLVETIKGLEKNEFSRDELNEAYLERIKKVDPSLNSYLYPTLKLN